MIEELILIFMVSLMTVMFFIVIGIVFYLPSIFRWIGKIQRPVFAHIIDDIAERQGKISPLPKSNTKSGKKFIKFCFILYLLLSLVVYLFPSLFSWEIIHFSLMFSSFIFWAGIAYFTPSVILRLVSVVASYLFNRRSQLFDERLERGISLLSNESGEMRRAGMFVLENLARKATTENKEQIIQIIHDFVTSNSPLNYDKDEKGEKVLCAEKPSYERHGIETAIKTIIRIVEHSKRVDKKISFREIDLRSLDFGELESNIPLDFSKSVLDEANFEGSKLNEANFSYAVLNRVNFLWAELTRANFSHAVLNRTEFSRARLREVNFQHAKLNGAYFYYSDCSEANFNNANELTQDQVYYMAFEKGKEPKLPEGLEVLKDHAYVWQRDKYGRKKRRFVKSDAEWSEWWID